MENPLMWTSFFIIIAFVVISLFDDPDWRIVWWTILPFYGILAYLDYADY